MCASHTQGQAASRQEGHTGESGDDQHGSFQDEQFWRLVPVLAELDMGTIFYRLTSPGFCGGFQFLFLTPLDEMTLGLYVLRVIAQIKDEMVR